MAGNLAVKLHPEQVTSFVEYLREDPVFAAELLFKIRLVPHERYTLRHMWHSRWILNVWGRGTGKCQCGTDRLLLQDGSYEELQNLDDKDVELFALDDNTFKLVPAKGKVQYNGKKRCLNIKLRSGREIIVTKNHPLLKIDGWESVDKLKVGDRVAVPRKYDLGIEREEVSELEAKLLGYLIGDGGTTKNICFTNANPQILCDYSKLVGEFDNTIKLYKGKNSSLNNKSTTLIVSGGKSSLSVFVEKHNLNCLAKEKRVPKSIFQSSNKIVASFLNRYFACDGYVSKNSIAISSACKGLIDDVQHLLLRFGINSKTVYKPKKLNGILFNSWSLYLYNKDSILTFAKEIGIFGKEEKLNELVAKKERQNGNTNVDTIPIEIWGVIKDVYGCEYKSRKHKRIYGNRCAPSREKLLTFAQGFKIPELEALATSDIFWDEIIEIQDIGQQKTYAVEVPRYVNYVSNDIINHNTFMDAVYACLRAILYPNEKIIIVGPSFRQSIFVFAEAEKLLYRTEFAKQTLSDKPKHHANEYKIMFLNGSHIIALPLGTDGSKIRGIRATVIIIDEAAQVPEEIIDMAVIPFMTTKKDPTAQYENVETETVKNTLVFSSSAYYQFNHLFEKYMYWIQQVREENPEYFVTKFNYFDLPEGFIDLEVVEMQRSTSPEIIFRMEYLADFPRDSVGFYPASLLHKNLTRFAYPLKKGRTGYKYILGLDPARSSDNFGMVLLELEGDYRNVVRVEAYNNKPFPVMKDRVLELMELFNIVRIGCDAYGGGHAIADLLAGENVVINPETGVIEQRPPILIVGDKEQRETHPHGRELLELVVFSSPTVAEMNYSLKARLENNLLRIPATPYASESVDEDAEIVFENIVEMLREMENIAVEPAGQSGYLKFDVPDGCLKDRYSALLVANRAADSYLQQPKQIVLPAGNWLSNLV